MKYHIITIGCQMNKADSERIATKLEELGYEWTDERYQADLVVITTCGVRQSAEDRVYGLIPKIKLDNKHAKIIISGCLSEREDVIKRLEDKVDLWLPAREISNLKFQISNKIKIPNSKIDPCEYLAIKPKYNSKFSAFVPIGNGCNNFCAYCVVPYARGREVYRPAEEIIREVENLVKSGYKEITLIAQNVNSYKSISNFEFRVSNELENIKFKEVDFAKLLKLINEIEGDFWIRFATSHPKDMSDELIKAIADSDKVCEYVHLPAQAGDNEVLANMNRRYTIEHYKELLNKIRTAVPNVAISTDIIVGFPGETEEQFNNTVKLFEEVKYDLAYIAQYSPRYGTVAEKMDDDVSTEKKKQREVILENIMRRTALENNQKLIGQEVSVLVEGKNRDGYWYGKTRIYKNTRFLDKGADLKGTFVNVKIISADVFGLEGEVVN